VEGTIRAVGDGLVRLDTALGPLSVAGIAAAVGGRARVRIRAEDVLVATRPPEALSARNVLEARIETVRDGQGPGVMLRLRIGDGAILARVTRASAREMGLTEGARVWAVLKTSSVARMDVGQ
jgi:molybdate transport system ATP-binding protein